jgi:hypothetical protein
MKDLHVWLPASVVKVRGNQQVDIQPLLQRFYKDGALVTLPVVQNVPVQMPRGTNYGIKYPISEGDTGIALFCERSLDAWLVAGGLVDPADSRTHDLSDAVFIPGLYPLNAQATGAATDLVIKNGGTEISINNPQKAGAGHILAFDETPGKEGVYLIHKTGARIEIDSSGDIKVVAADGSYIFLNGAKKTISATSSTGSLLSIGAGLAMVQGDGGDMVTVNKGQVQVLSSGSVTINGQSVTVGGSTMSAVLGEQLATYLGSHVHPTVLGPSGPPLISPSMNNASPGTSFLSTVVKLS